MSKSTTRTVNIPDGIELNLDARVLTIKNSKGNLSQEVNNNVDISIKDAVVTLEPADNSKHSKSLVGTYHSIINNMVQGLTSGFEKKLKLIGVGYRAKLNGNTLNLSLGFSHPVDYLAPEGVTIEVPSQTEVVVKGADKQKVGQVAADIRKFRPPEPYKGKGVRYVDEYVKIKEAKKK